MKAAQERIESELRIARDIQMSMVPHEFPQHEGLDMFASMTPAKEVGGDLYGYLIQGDFLEMQPNLPIGLFPGFEYEGEEIETVKGRALFIYTDGLNEAENPQQEQFGDERLLGILRDTHFDSAQQIIESLKAEVENHRKDAEPNDDLTMMCLRVN